MRILLLGKRHYTNKDALRERFGRIYQLPVNWHGAGQAVELALLDYRGMRGESSTTDGFPVWSLPARDPRSLFRLRSHVLRFRPDVIVASGDCFVGLVALWLAKRVRARFVFDVYDDYRTFGGYRAFVGWNAYDFLLRRADMTLYASQALADRHGFTAPWHLVPNGVDPMQFKPLDRDAARTRTGLDRANARLVGYFGGMDLERGVEDLIAAVGLLHAKGESVRLVLCGPARDGVPFDKPWVDFRGAVDHASIPDFINACDVVVLPYRRGPIIDMAASCKIAEYLLCDRPLVATDTPNFTSNFPKQASELGPALCSPGEPADLARAISLQLREPRIVSRPEDHTWSKIARDTLAALESLVVPSQQRPCT
jgi:glycosyltransferase involved in cell wall biosynthesis